jgi:hypothetical protein
MEKEERNEKEEFMSKVGNPIWYNLSPIRWLPPEGLPIVKTKKRVVYGAWC